jgi:predicted transglutaminase-like cysteine proteinase
MQRHRNRHIGAAWIAAVMLAAIAQPAAATSERPTFISLGSTSRPPIGWVDFCSQNRRECETRPMQARDVVLTPTTWRDLTRINQSSTPSIDAEH